MKIILIFFVIIIFVICPYSNFNRNQDLRKRIRKIFQNKLEECIINNSSDFLKNKIKKNEYEDLRNILFAYFSKLNNTDRELIRKCRREFYEKYRIMNRERFNDRLNHTYPYHHNFSSHASEHNSFNVSHSHSSVYVSDKVSIHSSVNSSSHTFNKKNKK